MEVPQTLKPGGFLFRLITTLVMIYLLLCRFLKLPKPFLLLKRLRKVDKYWSQEMVVNFVKTLGTKLPQDELCVPRVPDSYLPKVEVDPAHRLSEEEIREFYENGFLKPFTVWSEEEMTQFGKKLLVRRSEVNSVYGFVADRDRHLEMPGMMRMITHPAITDRIAQLLGPDLITWRSQIFYKPPRGRTGWLAPGQHLYVRESLRGTTHFPQRQGRTLHAHGLDSRRSRHTGKRLPEICQRLPPQGHPMDAAGGRHRVPRRQLLPRLRSGPRFRALCPKPGQVLIFSERTIHGSDPNVTDGNRLAFNFRIVEPRTEVYPGNKKFHRSAQMGHIYDMSKWNAVVIRGEDKTNVNKTVPWQQYG